MTIQLSTPSLLQQAIDFEKQAIQAKDPQEKLHFYLQGASLTTPRDIGLFETENYSKIEQFVKSSELWEESGNLFKDYNICLEKLNKFGLIDNYPAKYTYTSTCYFNAAETLIYAIKLNKLKDKDYSWNDKDDRTQQLLEDALWALKGIKTNKLDLEVTALLKEREAKILWSLSNLYDLHDKEKAIETNKTIYKQELALYDLYTLIANNERKESRTDWPSEMQRASHLHNAALKSPTPEDKENLLLKAEKIAQNIWYSYSSCTNHPEFSPEHKTNPEYTLLGKIQILLGHCTTFKDGLVVIDC